MHKEDNYSRKFMLIIFFILLNSVKGNHYEEETEIISKYSK